MGHLRNAIDAQWRSDFDAEREIILYPIKVAINLVRMAGLLVAIAITFGLATISTNFAQQVATWLGFGDSWVTSALLRVLAPALSLVAGWLTFCYIYIVVPRQRESWRRHLDRCDLRRPRAVHPAVRHGADHQPAVRATAAAAVFGPVIVVMLFFNLFAQLILIIAAWIATWDEPAFLNLDESRVRFALTPARAGRGRPADGRRGDTPSAIGPARSRRRLGDRRRDRSRAGGVPGLASAAMVARRLISGRRPSR